MNARKIITGALAAASISYAAKRAGSLDASGALAASMIGTCVYAGLGLRGTVLMLGFFIPSSALSKYTKRLRPSGAAIEKAGPRDAAQVFANGGIAALAALAGERPWARRAFAAALAAAGSDTWSTEIGTTFGGIPRSILSNRSDTIGMSGGVSDIGLLGGAAGAIWMALLAGAWRISRPRSIALAGLSGCLIDSVLGATLQARYHCKICKQPVEVTQHCDNATSLISGVTSMTNDVVNALSTAAAVLIACVAEPLD